MIDLIWEKISIEHKNEISHYIRMSNYPISDYNFTHMMIWKDAYQLELTHMDTFMVIRGVDLLTQKRYVYMPLGKGDIESVMNLLKNYFDTQNETFYMKAVTRFMEPALNRIKGLIGESSFERSDFEYLYKLDKLIHYSEAPLKRKREMCKYFEVHHPYDFVAYTSACYDDVLPMLKQWYHEAEIESDPILNGEWQGIQMILKHIEQFECKGFMVIVNHQVVGFILAEPLNPSSLVVHFEKGDRQFKGVYDIMIRDLCRQYASKYKSINLEEDMGLEGLRRAKGLYKPEYLIEKGQILFKRTDIQGGEEDGEDKP